MIVTKIIDEIAVQRTILSAVKADRLPAPLIDRYVLIHGDKRFFAHPGFDVFAIIRAIVTLIISGRATGASTIEQQLVRTVTGHNERTVYRKFREIKLARMVAKRFSKREILDAYLELAYMGHSIVGARKASLHLFGRMPWELSPSEAATIASLLLYPAPSRPSAKWMTKVARRRRHAMRFDEWLEIGSRPLPPEVVGMSVSRGER